MSDKHKAELQSLLSMRAMPRVGEVVKLCVGERKYWQWAFGQKEQGKLSANLVGIEDFNTLQLMHTTADLPPLGQINTEEPELYWVPASGLAYIADMKNILEKFVDMSKTDFFAMHSTVKDNTELVKKENRVSAMRTREATDNVLGGSAGGKGNFLTMSYQEKKVLIDALRQWFNNNIDPKGTYAVVALQDELSATEVAAQEAAQLLKVPAGAVLATFNVIWGYDIEGRHSSVRPKEGSYTRNANLHFEDDLDQFTRPEKNWPLLLRTQLKANPFKRPKV